MGTASWIGAPSSARKNSARSLLLAIGEIELLDFLIQILVGKTGTGRLLRRLSELPGRDQDSSQSRGYSQFSNSYFLR